MSCGNESWPPHSNGTIIVFDMGKDKSRSAPSTYLSRVWLKGEQTAKVESMTVNGMRAATTAFSGNVQGRAVTVRLVAIEWAPGEFYRFQMAIPKGVSQTFIAELKKTSYSFAKLSASEKNSVRPKKLIVLKAPSGSTVNSMASKMQVEGNKVEKFRVLNGMFSGETVKAGQPYKIVIN